MLLSLTLSYLCLWTAGATLSVSLTFAIFLSFSLYSYFFIMYPHTCGAPCIVLRTGQTSCEEHRPNSHCQLKISSRIVRQ